MSGTLFVVATPIGNLEDLSPRARQTLAEVDLIAAEDTRHTGRLLSHLGLKTRQFALHEHNEARAAQTHIEQLKDGKTVALVSDAGTPLVSDPGYRLLQAAHASGIAVSPVPGPSAVTAALSVSGLPTDRFGFEGFPPAKSAARRKWLQARAADNRTLLFFEAVHRIAATLTDMVEVFGADRQAFLGRELTKLHEQCRRASLGELLDEVASGAIVSKGEFVIAIHGAEDTPTSSIDADRLLAELAQVLPPKKAAMIAARVTGEKRNALYQRLLGIKSEGDA
jgi:16S rRNA (cytidine1402-2'-O)-methyltransferase